MNVIALPERVPDDDALLDDVVRDAHARHLHLVIDEHGRALLTSQVLPGQQRLYVLDKAAA